MVAKQLICASTELLERQQGIRFTLQRNGRNCPAFVVRYGGQVYAYLNQCAHVPVELDWNEGDFFDLSRTYLICATHGAYYQPDTGLCLGGPCRGQRLFPVSVIEEEGHIYYLEEKP